MSLEIYNLQKFMTKDCNSTVWALLTINQERTKNTNTHTRKHCNYNLNWPQGQFSENIYNIYLQKTASGYLIDIIITRPGVAWTVLIIPL